MEILWSEAWKYGVKKPEFDDYPVFDPATMESERCKQLTDYYNRHKNDVIVVMTDWQDTKVYCRDCGKQAVVLAAAFRDDDLPYGYEVCLNCEPWNEYW
jgi:hypothetical protein